MICLASNSERFPICVAEPTHYCRMDHGLLQSLLEMLEKSLIADDQGDPMTASRKLGELLIAGCPAIRIYSRKSLGPNRASDADISLETIGMYIFAQHIAKEGVPVPGRKQTAPEAMMAQIASSVRHRHRDRTVKDCIGLGRLYTAVKGGRRVSFRKVNANDISEEIGLLVYICSRVCGRFMPEPGERTDICGEINCPLKL